MVEGWVRLFTDALHNNDDMRLVYRNTVGGPYYSQQFVWSGFAAIEWVTGKRQVRHLQLISYGGSTKGKREKWQHSVASLGLVSPGAATDGVTPIFPPKKLATFFSHRYCYKAMTFFSCRLVTTPQLPSSDISHIFFIGVTPWRGPPPSDATDSTDWGSSGRRRRCEVVWLWWWTPSVSQRSADKSSRTSDLRSSRPATITTFKIYIQWHTDDNKIRDANDRQLEILPSGSLKKKIARRHLCLPRCPKIPPQLLRYFNTDDAFTTQWCRYLDSGTV